MCGLEWEPGMSWWSREGSWEGSWQVDWILEAGRWVYWGGWKEERRQFQEWEVWDPKESYVKCRGHGRYCHCIKGKARTSKRWGEWARQSLGQGEYRASVTALWTQTGHSQRPTNQWHKELRGAESIDCSGTHRPLVTLVGRQHNRKGCKWN